MPQISLYIDDNTLRKVERAAKKDKLSISKWVGNKIKRSFNSEYSNEDFRSNDIVAENVSTYDVEKSAEEPLPVLSVSDIDSRLMKSLKNAAKIDQTSVNNEIIMIIESYFNKRKTVAHNTAEWLKLAGSWEDDRSADEIIKDIKDSRTENKRFDDGLFD